MLILTDAEPRGLGYLEVDQRNVDAPVGQRHFETDTYTCTHCSVVVILNPARKRERYKCAGCSHHICDDCAALRVAGAPCKTIAQAANEALEQAARQPEPSSILP